ncbi:DNA-binding GntR family transcriptional regulator [Bacillus sp. SLBN-46]|jgi:DNA-binding GntR family transcriptional regulator|uniref:GntR family transcriptional regulator n=1 Tax=Bacillus sp. SLBN-46 TaxID=3042283 RepID=UPI00285ED22B|nr:GntR family transcriptional regulator [Bacillus sp. SLBN-46]MDR6123080.1 DNA-binding GntR family transcriptional regulator [Bacillus sp. SLBN-46]
MMEKNGLMIENRDTLHLRVCNLIRQAILKGDFKPGERLKQADLADAMGVSRMPIREAFQKLEAEGLIKLEPHKGAVVKSIHVGDIEEIYALRAELEKMAVYQSIEHLTDEDIKQLTVLVEQMELSEDVDEFINYNIEFHRLLIKRCTWERLNSFISTLWNGLPQQTPHILHGQKDTSNIEHRSILNAVMNKDKETAANLVSNHISRTGNMLVKSLKNEGK